MTFETTTTFDGKKVEDYPVFPLDFVRGRKGALEGFDLDLNTRRVSIRFDIAFERVNEIVIGADYFVEECTSYNAEDWSLRDLIEEVLLTYEGVDLERWVPVYLQ